MKRHIYKLLLLSFIAAFMSAGSIDLLAEHPATPIRLSTKVEVTNIPNTSALTLNWVDGDLKNELGAKFLITQFQKIEGKEKESQVAYVKREIQKERREYSYTIKELQNGDYCYTVTLVDDKSDNSSKPSERACVSLEKNNPDKAMHFSVGKELVKLNADGLGKFFVGVKNGTDCEFEVVVLESKLNAEVIETGKEGALISLSAKEKGQYTVLLGLKNKCNDEIVERLELHVCYGDCEDPHDKGMRFAQERMFIQLDEKGMSATGIKIINDTKCEFEIVVLQSMVKIAISEQNNQSALINFTADIKGKYISSIGLINKCTGELVSKMTFDICWGDCNPNEPGIYFEKGTEFSHKLQAGVAWKYDVNAISTDDCRLLYSVAFDKNGKPIAPEGLTLDEKTGVMSWENPISGAHKVTIFAKSTCDDGLTFTTIVGTFNLIVQHSEPEFTSILKCNFSEESGLVEDFFGKVTVWSANDKDPGVPPTPNRYSFTSEIRGATASFKLPAGKYFLRADAKGYKGQYYETAFELKDAKVIEVGDNETVEVSMILHSIPEPKSFVVTGQVTDAATGEPLSAIVTFLPVKSVLGGVSDNNHNDPGLNFVNKVRTDEKGNYSIKLPDTFTYYANANSVTNESRYKLQWFEGADSYYEADIIYLESNKDGVNFKLEMPEATQGYIGGTVTDKEGNAVMSTVIALHKDEKTEYKAVTKTDEKGNFSFSNLKYGDYVVLSLPAQNNYVPGYYVEGDITTPQWKNATSVSVGDFVPTPAVNILHATSDKEQAKGIARIKGHLHRGIKGITPGGPNEDNSSEAINGGLVYLTDGDGDIVNHFISDIDGYFELEGLEPGTYTLGIDKFGFDEYSKVVVIDYSENIEVNTDIILSQITTSVDYLDFGKAKLTVSPMPVTNISHVSFDGKAGNSTIKLVDMTGNTVYQSSLNTNNGNNTFDLDAKNVSAGIYILVIENEEKSVAGSITIIK